MEVYKPADEPTLAPPQEGPPAPPPLESVEPEERAPETGLFGPETQLSPSSVEPAPNPATAPPPPATPPDETEPTVPEPQTPGGVEPPASIPDVRGLPSAPENPAPPETAPASTQPAAHVAPADEHFGVIGIWVPSEVRVIINGLETKSTGRYREYVSYNLKPGAVYRYEIRAQLVRDGRLIESTRTVYLTAGAHKRVAFHFESKPEQAIAARW